MLLVVSLLLLIAALLLSAYVGTRVLPVLEPPLDVGLDGSDLWSRGKGRLDVQITELETLETCGNCVIFMDFDVCYFCFCGKWILNRISNIFII